MSALDDLDAAIQQLATDGIATVTVGNQTTTVKSLDELIRWRDRVKGDATAATNRAGLGIRVQSIKPYYP